MKKYSYKFHKICKNGAIEFSKNFFFGIKFGVFFLLTKKKFFYQKNAYYTSSIFGNSMTNNFLMATTKVILKCPPNFQFFAETFEMFFPSIEMHPPWIS